MAVCWQCGKNSHTKASRKTRPSSAHTSTTLWWTETRQRQQVVSHDVVVVLQNAHSKPNSNRLTTVTVRWTGRPAGTIERQEWCAQNREVTGANGARQRCTKYRKFIKLGKKHRQFCRLSCIGYASEVVPCTGPFLKSDFSLLSQSRMF